MKNLIFALSIFLMIFIPSIHSQDQSIFIFDPNGVSSGFQSTLSQLTDDYVFVADTLDDIILNYDAAFLFIDYPYLLSESNVNTLINYTSAGSPVYIYSEPFVDSTTSPFWNHIGLEEMYWLLVSSLVDSVTGIDTTFTTGIVIDTSFMSWSVPAPMGTLSPILIGQSAGLDVQTTYLSTVDTLNVILDLFNLIYNYDFLKKVLEHFGLIPLDDVEDEFNLVTGFELSQNYPNPFNPSTKIKFTVPVTLSPSINSGQAREGSLVTLKVYDVLGNEIATLVNEEKQPGTYEVGFDGTGLPSGIYFYQLKSGNFVGTKKMLLLK